MDVVHDSKITAIRLTGSIASTVCLVVITSILLLLIFHKAYNTTLQRLLLYLTIITVIQEACETVGYNTIQFEYSGHKTFCDMISIVWGWSYTVGYLLTLGIIVFLPFKVYEQIKGAPFPRLSRSRCFCIAAECLFIFVVLVLPLIYAYPSCFPVQWCGTPPNNIDKNCPIVVIIGQYVLRGLNFYDFSGVIVVIFTIVLSIIFCCFACKYRETRQPVLKTLCRTLILLGLFVASTAITVLLNILLPFKIEYPDGWYIYQLVNAVLLPVTQIVLPLGFLFYLYSFKLFHWRAIKRAAAEWRCFRSCCGRENAPGADQIREPATVPSRSHRVTAPSVTFFDVPFTGAFSNTATEEQQALLPDGDGDTRYGSVVNAV